MSTCRSLLRTPALFGVLLLLFSGVREAYAFGTCPMMHPGGGQVEVVEVEVVEAHAHHTEPFPGETQHHEHTGDQAEGCECRLLCLSVPVTTPPQPLVFSFDTGLPPEPLAPPVVEDSSLLPSLHLPYLLPFAHAPPAVS